MTNKKIEVVKGQRKFSIGKLRKSFPPGQSIEEKIHGSH